MCYALDISVDPGRANTGCTWALSDVYRVVRPVAEMCAGLNRSRELLRGEVNHPQLKQGACPYPTPPGAGEMFGKLTIALRPMLVAATVSAIAEKWQNTQENRD